MIPRRTISYHHNLESLYRWLSTNSKSYDGVYLLPIDLNDTGYNATYNSNVAAGPERKRDRFLQHFKDTPKKGDVAVIGMSEEEYRSYWARDEHGKYQEGVIEPEGGRLEWMHGRIKKQDVEANMTEFMRRKRRNDQSHLRSIAGSNMASALP